MKGLTSKQMSKIYKNNRNRGKNHYQAYKITGIAKRLSKTTRKGRKLWVKKKYPYEDFDGDKKVNKYDCQPLNKYKQDKTPEEKIKESNKQWSIIDNEHKKDRKRKGYDWEKDEEDWKEDKRTITREMKKAQKEYRKENEIKI